MVGLHDVFDSVPASPAPGTSQAIVERTLRWNIATGVWKPGQAMPSERELASRLGVGRKTLRSAIEALRSDGLLLTSVGRSGSTRLTDSGPSLDERRSPRYVLHHFELRCAVEPEAAALAAVRGSTRDFDRLRELLQRRVAGVAHCRALYSQFHIGIAEASGNSGMTRVIAELCADYFTWGWRTEAHRDFAPAHRSIYHSLMTRDPVRAREVVRTHLAEARDSHLEAVD